VKEKFPQIARVTIHPKPVEERYIEERFHSSRKSREFESETLLDLGRKAIMRCYIYDSMSVTRTRATKIS